eukprot:scaffold13.g287.t1
MAQAEGRRRFKAAAARGPRRLVAVVMAVVAAVGIGGGLRAVGFTGNSNSSVLGSSAIGGRSSGSGGGRSGVAAGGSGGGGPTCEGCPPTWADGLNSTAPPEPPAEVAALHAGLGCLESGYCSLGRVGPAYVGEVDSTEGLRAALRACAFKREVALVTIGDNSHVLGLSLLMQMWRLGLANVMLLGKGPASCTRLQQAGFRNWWRPRTLQSNVDLWNRRILLLARIYLKASPFSEFNHVGLLDGGNNARLDGAEAWVMGAAAERLLSEVMSDVLASLKLRHPAFRYSLRETFTEAERTRIDETLNYYRDRFVIEYPKEWEWIAGRRSQKVMGFRGMRIPYLGGNWSEALGWKRPPLGNATRHFLKAGGLAAARARAARASRGSPVQEAPAAAAPRRPAATRLPGRCRAPGGGRGSAAHHALPSACAAPHPSLQRLEEESSHPFFNISGPDPPPALPHNESFMMLPRWMCASWGGRGVEGYFALRPPPQVMVHMMYMGVGDAPMHDKKLYALKAHGAFHYKAAEVRGGAVGQGGAGRALEGKLIPVLTKAGEVPKVLAFAPGLRVMAQTERAHRDAVARLVRLAMRLGRILLMPEAYCNSPWISARPGQGVKDLLGHKFGKASARAPRPGLPACGASAGALPALAPAVLRTRPAAYRPAGPVEPPPVAALRESLPRPSPHPPAPAPAILPQWDAERVFYYGVDDRRHCIWWPSLATECMPGAYTVQPDFKALLPRLPPAAAQPSAANTLFHHLLDVSLTQSAAPDPTAPDKVVELLQPGDHVLEAARALDAQPVVYIGASLRLVPDLSTGSAAEEAAWQRFNTNCRWMRPGYFSYCNNTATNGAKC